MSRRILVMENQKHYKAPKIKRFYAGLVIITLLSTGCAVLGNTARNESEPEITPPEATPLKNARYVSVYDVAEVSDNVSVNNHKAADKYSFVSGEYGKSDTYSLVEYPEEEGDNNTDITDKYIVYRNDTDAIDTSTDAKDKSAWNLILVNAYNPLPDSFSVNLIGIGGGHAIDRRAYESYIEMMNDARAEGLSPIVCSSYRTTEKQTQLFNKQIDKFLAQGYPLASAKLEAAKWVAAPGTSEHQTGLALDIVAYNYQLLDEAQENTEEQIWLMQNAHRYGFILRYPQDKSDVTGIHYEPWHYRYVGKEAATAIYEAGLCLEEYLDTL